jgi:hypothetical protein
LGQLFYPGQSCFPRRQSICLQFKILALRVCGRAWGFAGFCTLPPFQCFACSSLTWDIPGLLVTAMRSQPMAFAAASHQLGMKGGFLCLSLSPQWKGPEEPDSSRGSRIPLGSSNFLSSLTLQLLTILGCFQAANFLHIDPLLDVCCTRIAIIITGVLHFIAFYNICQGYDVMKGMLHFSCPLSSYIDRGNNHGHHDLVMNVLLFISN